MGRSSRMMYSKKELRLLLHRHPRVVGEFRELLAVGRVRFQGAGLQPLAAEVLRPARWIPSFNMRRTWVRSSAGWRSSVFGRKAQQLVVRDAAPEEIREAGGQFAIAHRMCAVRGLRLLIAFDAEQKVGGDEHALEGETEAFTEGIALLADHGYDAGKLIDLLAGGGAAVDAARQGGDDLLGARRRLFVADEDALAALGGGSGDLIVRSGDLQIADQESDGGAAAENAVAIGGGKFVVVVGGGIGLRATRGGSGDRGRGWRRCARLVLHGLRDRPDLRRATPAAEVWKDSGRERRPGGLHRCGGKTPKASVRRR